MKIRSLPLVALLSSCSLSDCDNTIIYQVANPDKTLSAILFERDCGATTAGSFQLSVLQNGASPSGVGNALVLNEPAHFDSRYWPHWDGNNRVRMAIPNGTIVFHQSRRVGTTEVIISRDEP